MELSRRGLIGGLLAAPAVVVIGNIMPVRVPKLILLGASMVTHNPGWDNSVGAGLSAAGMAELMRMFTQATAFECSSMVVMNSPDFRILNRVARYRRFFT